MRTCGTVLLLNLFIILKYIKKSHTADIKNVCDESNSNNSFIFCYGRILEAVNHFGYYKDAKTFVDMPLKYHPNKTISNFNELFNVSLPIEHLDNATLNQFISSHFSEPGTELHECTSKDWKDDPYKLSFIKDPVYNQWAHKLHKIWTQLCKKMDEKVKNNPELYSLIYVPHQFIAPGGRFREFYYWDTYWIIRGLLVSEMYQTAKNMIRNFASMVERYGFVPNGGRIYYLQRSQPPLLIPMVYEYVIATRDRKFVKEILPVMEKELKFWQRERTVNITDGNGEQHYLYQYNTETNVPRPESYRPDVHTTQGMTIAEKREVWRDIASAAESGWDFSSRWFGDRKSLQTIRTRKIIPVDLNSFICWNMEIMQFIYEKIGKHNYSQMMARDKDRFRRSFVKVFYNTTLKAWFDWDTEKHGHNTDFYPSMAVPLFTGCYQSLNYFKPSDLFDYLNYDVTVREMKPGTGGEYDVQTGFGWTNGVILDLLYTYGNRLKSETTVAANSANCSSFVFVSLIFFVICSRCCIS